jgi:hypothetical protein
MECGGLPPLFLQSDIDLTYPNLKIPSSQLRNGTLNYVNP